MSTWTKFTGKITFLKSSHVSLRKSLREYCDELTYLEKNKTEGPDFFTHHVEIELPYELPGAAETLHKYLVGLKPVSFSLEVQGPMFYTGPAFHCQNHRLTV